MCAGRQRRTIGSVNLASDITLSRAEKLKDWALAGALTAFGWMQLALVPIWMAGPGRGAHRPEGVPVPFVSVPVAAPTWAAFALVALVSLPLAWRRRYPLAVLASTVLFAGLYDLLHQPPVLVTIAPLVALYTVGTLVNRRTLITHALSTAAFTLAVSIPFQPSGRMFAEAVRLVAMIAFAAALGDATRNRRAYVAEVEQRALEAERSREEEARQRVEEERLRIARELHDVTAHSLSIIAVQAGAAEKVVDRDPAAAKRALETIRATSKASLDELRAMLGVLRGNEDGAPLAPAGSVTRLGELAAAVEQAGVHVELNVGDLGDVPAYAEVSVYRIVQEALTNVVRHARASVAQVSLAREGDALVLEIADDGAGASAGFSEGHGIAGMRERIAALGGEFSAGPRDEGGYLVRAAIPLQGGAS
jgi:signal transduction histidine kinase